MFTKGYVPQFTTEVFKIVRRFFKKRAEYELHGVALDDEIIGRFTEV